MLAHEPAGRDGRLRDLLSHLHRVQRLFLVGVAEAAIGSGVGGSREFADRRGSARPGPRPTTRRPTAFSTRLDEPELKRERLDAVGQELRGAARTHVLDADARRDDLSGRPAIRRITAVRSTPVFARSAASRRSSTTSPGSGSAVPSRTGLCLAWPPCDDAAAARSRAAIAVRRHRHLSLRSDSSRPVRRAHARARRRVRRRQEPDLLPAARLHLFRRGRGSHRDSTDTAERRRGSRRSCRRATLPWPRSIGFRMPTAAWRR